MSQKLDGKRIAFVATDGVEAVELREPWAVLTEAGAIPTLVSIEAGRIQGYDHLTASEQFDVDKTALHAHADDYDALVLPGGVANPDRLRTDTHIVDFVRGAVEMGTPVGVICHGPWTLVSAGVVKGRRMTSWPSLRDDLINAGADWVDEQVVVDTSGPGVLVSSRKPDDLPTFGAAIVEQFGSPT
ncbi:MAG TPA: type 1 glutamine amidotransferase domain-containing protein [Acidimicrobiales bacterium]|nr:type 1 glutamine amidotransferase domain-containing protein [Acidimicrobiales bacterium]